MFAIRNLATKEGNVPLGVLTQAKNLIKTGRVVELSESAIGRREEVGLPKGPSTDLKEVQKILKATLEKIIPT